MLQPRKTHRIISPCLRNHLSFQFRTRMVITLLNILILITVNTAASQTSNQPYLVSPTPTLPAKVVDDITTVLLLNNESGHVGDIHGRFLTVRPEIGLLTSTARTFIQDGITTEFATKIVGTTLSNGRLYAQYIKKSSRVLFENEHLTPSVVTSWVGERASQQTPQFLQSHNDLFNSDDADWQNVDDNLGVQQVEFVGNTDFITPQTTIVKYSMTPALKENKPITSLESVITSNDTLNFNLNGIIEKNKLISDKVFSITNLKTYTIKSNIEDIPNSAFQESATDSYALREERKYEMLRQPSQGHQSLSTQKPFLATVTYYGFAEFTTIVGDSVIVFSPSTLESSMHFGQVTSIKGNPTLQPDFIHDYHSQNVEITQSSLETVETLEQIELLSKKSSLGSDISAFTIENQSNDILTPQSTASLETNFKSLLVEEAAGNILIPDVLSSSTAKNDLKSESTNDNNNLEKLEGAKTVYIDDDPFSRFVELSDSSSSKSEATDQDSTLNYIHLSNNEDIKNGTLKTSTVDSDIKNMHSLTEEPIVGTGNIYDTNIKDTCSHTTSQVFLTQMPKPVQTSNGNIEPIAINDNPLLSYDIVETTKFYCIQASKAEQESGLSTINESHETVTESNGELMSTELIDDVDETTVRGTDDYDVTTENEYEGEDDDYENNADDVDLIYKTLYTTYTYLTTFFEGSSSTVASHTEILTNIVSSTLGAEGELKSSNLEGQFEKASIVLPKYTIPLDIAGLLTKKSTQNDTEVENTISTSTSNFDDLKYSKTLFTTYTYYTSIFKNNDTEVQSRSEIVTNYITDEMPNSQQNIIISGDSQTSDQSFLSSQTLSDVDMSLGMELKSSSSNYTASDLSITTNSLEDQVSSESNTEEIIPSATFLLQTSFTTFTFYTTMYVGEDSNIISRLETVTNIATETLKPTKVVVDDSSFPITYFTTFTYWTKLAKDGEITTLSREETLSNVIQPTNVTEIVIDDSSNTEVEASQSTISTKSESNSDYISNSTNADIRSETTTYYTTYTYYTTSYEVNNTIIDSRFETVTNLVTAGEVTISASTLDMMPKSSQSESATENPIETKAKNVVLYDYKQIIDADEISTLYFTTEVLSSLNSEGHEIEITSSSSRLLVDESKKASLATILSNTPDNSLSSLKMHKTGLVRLIEGKRVQNSTTTLYQSKVIGTVIDNRYAQIIESTSSFFFEKYTPTDYLVSSTVQIPVMATANGNFLNSTNNINTESQDATVSDIKARDDLGTDGLAPQNTKPLFAPVIRPFASRNRPTFAPKQKTLVPSSATIITRSDITPTITATPALKSAGKYSSSRRGVISNAPINPNEFQSLSQGQASRRLFGRPTKPLSNSAEANGTLPFNIAFSPSKNRFVSSSRNVVSSRRQSINYRSSNVPGFRGSGIIANSRLRIKPTNSVLVSTQSFSKVPSSDSSSEEENSTDEINEEDESPKHTNNPLTRFRRPLSGPNAFTPAIRQSAGNSPAVSLRRNPLSTRSKTSTTTSSTTTTTTKPRTRSFQRPLPFQSARSRPQNSLFPPRGLFQSLKKEESSKEVKPNDSATENDPEYVDDDVGNAEESSPQENVYRIKRSVGTLTNPKRNSRVRRQADALKISRFRFRRQNQTATLTKEDSKLFGPEVRTETTPTSREKISSRFGSRFRSPQGQQTTLLESTTVANHKSIRPTRPITKRPQFTLREKDVTLKGPSRSSTSNNFRRQQATGNASIRRAGTSNTGNSNSRRLKGLVSYNNKNNGDHGRLSNVQRSRSSSSNTLNRGRSRGRNRNEFSPDLQSIEHEVHSITVTHFIPSELTIPVVNGHVTEYKNIVTAKASTEVVGPDDYMQVLGTNGLSSIYLNREISSINIAGATEHTKYLLHESITSSIIFTPTTIRGRKTSFSHVVPSTAYSVEYLVTTIQPQIPDNAPLANILLSQLLLGNLNLPAQPILGAVGQLTSATLAPTSVEPVTEYRTHTSTYVTTIFDGKSTILPITFQGKKILTTVYDTTAQTITATEYSVDTIVNTVPLPYNTQSIGQAAQVNNLLLQQLLLQQQQDGFSLPQAVSKTVSPQIFLSENLQDLEEGSRLSKQTDVDFENDSDFMSISSESQPTKSNRKKSRKTSSGHKRSKQRNVAVEPQDPSVVTLYVSGRRPGEFSTVLSTVGSEYDHSAALQKREAFFEIQPTVTSMDHYIQFPNTEEIEDFQKHF
ncbi:uncharacterized protein LOC108098397 isoform X1 [Drosophila ficusphila]|uniref:uncharacterized protein LOC108098397 isoform X1 n=1 Tax=Drosophila ficusphila TaxID=30025 RepID=UPI0007E860FC|nr:uncharacterized protein LOC108098397 isoform X1 [Drosophila ficusphila]